MATAYTSLLGLALPVQGELQGTWGDTVNNSITSLLDTAVAGTTTLSSDADVTLTTTTGASNQARQAIILWTASGTVTRNITAPAQSKIYTVINKTGSTQSIVLRGVGPTTGVTIPAGAAGTFAWNGTDFVDISNYVSGNKIINGNLTVNGNTTLGDAAGDTITVNGATTFANVNPTLSAGTANGVLYLNGSKVATSGSALTFDGTTFATTARTSSANGAWVGSGAVMGWGAAGTFSNYIVGDTTSNYLLFQVNSAEGMRLTSTGLGIGTSSPAVKLHLYGVTTNIPKQYLENGDVSVGGQIACQYFYSRNTGNNWFSGIDAYVPSGAPGVNFTDLRFYTTSTERMRLDSSGNLGLGVTPSAWGSCKVLEIGAKGNAIWNYNGLACDIRIDGNAYFNGTGYTYGGNGFASEYAQSNGGHIWFTAPSGTAGNAITFTQAMTLAASGNLLLGTTMVGTTGSSGLTVYDATQGEIRIQNSTSGTGTTKGFQLAIASSDAYLWNFQSGAMLFATNNAERARIDSSGNLGLGVTPSAWGGSYKAIELPGISVANLNGGTNQQAQYLLNAYDSGAGAWKYKITGVSAAMYRQAADASHEWHLAPSGTAGNAITFTQAMTLDSSGNLGVGATTLFTRASIAKSDTATSIGANYNPGILNIQNSSATNGNLSLIGFQDASSFVNLAAIGAINTTHSASPNNVVGELAFYTKPSGSGYVVERARITSGGSFQIGSATLSEPRLYVYDNDTTDAAIIARQDGSAPIQIWQGSSAVERARIDSSGNFGIGTSSPAAKFETFNSAVNAAFVANTPSTWRVAQIRNDQTSTSGSAAGIAFVGKADTQPAGIVAINENTTGGVVSLGFLTVDNNVTTERMRITSDGNLGLGVTPSAWWSAMKPLQMSGNGFIGSASNYTYVGANFFYNSSANPVYVASAAASLYEQGAGGHRFYTAPSGTAGNAITFTQAMTLDASGNLGVGTTSPVGVLEASSATPVITASQNNTAVTANMLLGAFNAYSYDSSTNSKGGVGGVRVFAGDTYNTGFTPSYLAFYTHDNVANNNTLLGAATERARITSGGYFKASNDGNYTGVTNTYHEFYQTANNTGLYIRSTNGSYTATVLECSGDRTTTNTSYYLFDAYNGNVSGRFRVADSGNATNTNGSYGTISDAKMKTDIVDAGSQWADIKAIRFRKFKMKNDPSGLVQLGVVAQELEQTSPGLVEQHTDRDAEGNDLGTTTKSVKTSVLLMKAAVALQEAMARIEQLEAKVAALESK